MLVDMYTSRSASVTANVRCLLDALPSIGSHGHIILQTFVLLSDRLIRTVSVRLDRTTWYDPCDIRKISNNDEPAYHQSRCIMGAIGTAVVNPIMRGIGQGWTMVRSFCHLLFDFTHSHVI
jgi:hypothetical protein